MFIVNQYGLFYNKFWFNHILTYYRAPLETRINTNKMIKMRLIT